MKSKLRPLSPKKLEELTTFYENVKTRKRIKNITGYETFVSFIEEYISLYSHSCIFCGEKMWILRRRETKQKTYCSNVCRAAMSRIKRRMEDNPHLSFEELRIAALLRRRLSMGATPERREMLKELYKKRQREELKKRDKKIYEERLSQGSTFRELGIKYGLSGTRVSYICHKQHRLASGFYDVGRD